jgi:uncharacterized protein (TIGR02145 family)
MKNQLLAIAFVSIFLASCDSTSSKSAEAPWSSSISYGTLVDMRDNQSYRTVKIGDQTWMAQNLNYQGETTARIGLCYDSSPSDCSIYGRLYQWVNIMHGASSSATIPSGVQGICPSGWHVPSSDEWTTLQTYVDPTNTVDAFKLKAQSGWNNYNGKPDNGPDTYGFRALPGGIVSLDGFGGLGQTGDWWTATVPSRARRPILSLVCPAFGDPALT